MQLKNLKISIKVKIIIIIIIITTTIKTIKKEKKRDLLSLWSQVRALWLLI